MLTLFIKPVDKGTDKGIAIVIMDKADYIKEGQTFE